MQKFQFHILLKVSGATHREYRAIRPSFSIVPYQYDTFEEADRMARMCYPDAYRHGAYKIVGVPYAKDNV